MELPRGEEIVGPGFRRWHRVGIPLGRIGLDAEAGVVDGVFHPCRVRGGSEFGGFGEFGGGVGASAAGEQEAGDLEVSRHVGCSLVMLRACRGSRRVKMVGLGGAVLGEIAGLPGETWRCPDVIY